MGMGSTSILLFGIFVLLLVLNVPIAISLGIAALAAVVNSGLPIGMIATNVYSASSKFALLAIPFFIIGGNIMEKAGISEQLITFAKACVGHRRIGIAMVCVIVCCFFAAISGSGPATVAALGLIMIPAMVEAGYGKTLPPSLMAAGGAIGVIIPPSVTFIVYGSISGASIGKMFMAGIVPGIMMGLALVIAVMFMVRNKELKHYPKASGAERWKAFKSAFWGLLMPIIILGGIYSGVFTPTESAAVSAVYGFFVGLFIYKKLKIKDLGRIFIESASQTGVVMWVMICASLFAWVVTVDGVGVTIGNMFMAISGGNLYIYLLIVNILLIFVGMVMDANSALYIFVPILLPVAQQLGYDVVAFGIMMCVNLAIGLVTPPVGVNLFVACNIAEISIKDLIKDILPLIAAFIVVLLLITYIPQISLFLPSLMGM